MPGFNFVSFPQLKASRICTDYDHIFESAARRWEEVVIGDLEYIPSQEEFEDFDWFNGEFGTPYAGEIDDLVIGYAMSPSEFFEEGEGVLGFAKGTAYRTNDFDRYTLPVTTIAGVMRFNTDFIAQLGLTENDISAIVLHEMGKPNGTQMML